MTETAPSHLCVSCGYDLAGLAAPGVCPECAKPFDTHAVGDRISEPWPCLRCGYPLLDHRRMDRCAECGVPVRFSLRSDLLRFQPAHYRRRLRTGAIAAEWGMACTIVLPIFFGMVIQVWFSPINFELVATGVALIAIGLWAFGWMLVLSRPPTTLEFTRPQRRVRVVARVSLLALAGLTVASTILAYLFALRTHSSGSAAMMLPQATGVLWLVAVAAFFFTSMWTLMILLTKARSAKRSPSASAIIALILGAVTGLSWLGMVLASLIAGSSHGQYAMNLGAAATVLGVIGGIGSIVLFFAVLGTLDRLRAAVKRVDREVAAVAKHSRLGGETHEKPAAERDPPRYAED